MAIEIVSHILNFFHKLCICHLMRRCQLQIPIRLFGNICRRQWICLHICCCRFWCRDHCFYLAFGNGHCVCIAVPAYIIAKAFCQISCRSIDTAVHADGSHVHSFCFVRPLQVLIFITLGIQCEFYDLFTVSEICLIQGRIPVYFQTHCFYENVWLDHLLLKRSEVDETN